MKICGISAVGEARAAIRAGANAVGFVFAGGPRKVSPALAGRIGAHVHPSLWKIGVFADASLDGIAADVETAGLDGVQLHGSETVDFVARLRSDLPGLLIFKAIRVSGKDSVKAAEHFAEHVDVVMLDPKDVAHPERRAEPIPLEWLADVSLSKVIIAGGLSPQNVGEVVAALQPWGVDASGSLEVRPGVKDPAKISAFVRAVRHAEKNGSKRSPLPS